MLKNTVSMIIVVCAFGLVLGAAGTALAEAKIAYPCDGVDPLLDTQLCLSNVDGSDAVELTNFSTQFGQPISSISWGVSGSEIFFTRYVQSQEPIPGIDGGGMYLLRIDSDGNNLEAISLERPYRNENSQYMAPIAWTYNVPNNVASISPFGQFVIVFLLGGATALYLNRKPESVGV